MMFARARTMLLLTLAITVVGGCGSGKADEADAAMPVMDASAGDSGPMADAGGNMDASAMFEDAGSDAGYDAGPTCVEASAVLHPSAPRVMLVLDKSGSMFANYWDHDGSDLTPQITRWHSLYDGVADLLEAREASVDFGAKLFPSAAAENVYGPAACITSDATEATVASSNRATILASIPGSAVTDSYGGTPAALGLEAALDHLVALGAGAPRAMVLVTDGAANCSQDAESNNERFEVLDPAAASIASSAWTTHGIPTYVVGIGIVDAVLDDGIGGDPNGVNPATFLEGLATTAGTGTWYPADDQAELDAALDDAVSRVRPCYLPLESAAASDTITEVSIGGAPWPHVDDCATEDGWVYDAPAPPYEGIATCGAACEALSVAGEAGVRSCGGG